MNNNEIPCSRIKLYLYIFHDGFIHHNHDVMDIDTEGGKLARTTKFTNANYMIWTSLR